jgi:3-oxo-5alpha-steroid 4-dehydrogenase
MSTNIKPSTRWDGEVDVAVVGFGAAGACAALEAALHGARVAVLDRFHGGGATVASGAVIYAGGGTPYQRAAGYDDTPEAMHRYLKLEIGDVVPDVTLRRFCVQSAENIAWLEEAGIPFEASLCPFKTSYPTDDYYLYFSGNELAHPYRVEAEPAPRGHRAKGRGISGSTLFRGLRDATHAQGILVRTQTQVQRLLSSPAGKIVGVEGRAIPPGSWWAVIHGRFSRINAKATIYAPPVTRQITALLDRIMDLRSKPFRLRARAGVVLAAGGFVFNPEMVAKHAPLYQRCLPLGTAGDDGTGIGLGQSVGGTTARMERMSAWSFYVPPRACWSAGRQSAPATRSCTAPPRGI